MIDLSSYKSRDISSSPNGYRKRINRKKLPLNDMGAFSEKNIVAFNEIYKRFSFCEKEWTPSGGLSVSHVDFNLPSMWQRTVFLGEGDKAINSAEIYVYCDHRLYGFIIGKPRKDEFKTLTGTRALREIEKIAEEKQIDLSPVTVTAEEGKRMKAEIEHPLVGNACVSILDLDGYITNVCHIDFHEMYRYQTEKAYPFFKPIFQEVDNVHKEHNTSKLIINSFIGIAQSKYSSYRYTPIAKNAINGCRKDVYELSQRVRKAGYIILGYNTDGFWYRRRFNSLPIEYHGEGEGKEYGQWTNDYVDCKWTSLQGTGLSNNLWSHGANWIVLDGTYKGVKGFYKGMRGLYGYANVKRYDDWNCLEDIQKALASEEDILVSFDKKKGWSVKEDFRNKGRKWGEMRDMTMRVVLKGGLKI